MHGLGTRVRGHDDDHVTEVGLAPVVICQRAVVHDLQQHVEDVWVRFFDFIEQQHGVRLLGDSFRQQTALVVAHIAGRRANQAADRMALHVLRHVEADQVHTQNVGQLLGCLGLAHACRAAEQEGANRLVWLAQAGARHLDGRGQHFQRLVLTENHALEVTLQGLQLAAVVIRDIRRGNARHLGNDFLNLGAAHHCLAIGLGLNALGCARFVNHVNGLVRQVTVVDVLGRQLCCCFQRFCGIADAVVLFKARLQTLEDFNGLRHRGLHHIHFLETARQGSVFFKDATVFRERGRTNALELTAGQRRLDQVGSIERAARRSTRTDQGVNLINEQHGIGFVLERLEYALEALLKITAVLGACQQCTHVQRIHHGVLEHLRHRAFGDAPCQAFCNGRFTNACFTHQQRVVLAAAAQDLDGAFDFVVATDQRIDLAFLGGLVQVQRELFQRRGFFIALTTHIHFFAVHLRLGLASFRRIALANTVCDVVDHVQTCDTLLVQVVHGVGIFLAKDSDQHVGAGDFLLAIACGLHMHDGALNHTLKAQRGLRVHLFRSSHLWGVVPDEVAQRGTQIFDVGGAGTQHIRSAGVVQQGVQQVLHRDELVALLSRLDKSHVQADFQFLGNHVRTPLCLRLIRLM